MANPKHPIFELPDYPCPECGEHMLLGYYFFTAEGNHQHTHYVCMFWPTRDEAADRGWEKLLAGGQPDKCGWHGWTVPSPPSRPEPDLIMDSARKIVNYILEKAEVSVEKRQEINDFCDAFARQEIEDLIEEMPGA